MTELRRSSLLEMGHTIGQQDPTFGGVAHSHKIKYSKQKCVTFRVDL
jgi:hypothetical protein